MKTSELNGAALDWAVAKCEGTDSYWFNEQGYHKVHGAIWTPSTDWGLGGGIIEHESICLRRGYTDDGSFDGWTASLWLEMDTTIFGEGDTPLVAAMRCYVASKLGDEIDVPEELLK